MIDSPLFTAAHAGDLDTVRALVAGGATLEQRDSRGRTALAAAAIGGHPEVVAFLLAAEADPLARDNQRRVPLDHASTADVARLLPGADGAAGLHGHVTSGRDEVVAVLLDRGADPHLRDAHGKSALHHARTPAMVRMLVAAGASPHAVDREGLTPLHHAPDVATARALLAAGADPHATDPRGRTPLHTAADADLIAVLLGAEVPVDVPDGRGWTPLAHRAYFTYAHPQSADEAVRVIQVLIDAGADVTRRDADGIAPIHRLRRHPGVLADAPERAAIRRRQRAVAEPSVHPGLVRRVSPERAIGLPQHRAAVHPGGAEAVTAGPDGILVRWSLRGAAPRPAEVTATDRPPFAALAVSPDGTLLALAGGESQPLEIRRWDRLDEVVAVVDELPSCESVSFSPDGRLIAAGWWSPGGGHGLAVVAHAGPRVTYGDAYAHGVDGLVFAPDGRLVVSWLGDETELALLGPDLDDADEVTFEGIACQVEALSFAPDGRRLAVCGAAPSDARTSAAEPGMIVVFDADSRRPVWRLTVDQRVKQQLQAWHDTVKPLSVCFTPDGRRVVAGLTAGLLVLDADTGAVVHARPWWPRNVTSVHAADSSSVLVTNPEGFHRVVLPAG
ncbi:ankyrin repeat domain-containing protein [Catenuloplanes indicus]|uniref:Ankyrin repeat protein n=1 Tax=Catenuloplanes indicus TaxID=137267 RepID=A0AAE3VWH5_9ACTN|nr:ankyrin repeat domain-containing protein [Catenuloplanes indicus]MDQ0364315.1 ankyrin repeat protein [Catenuloplanes indicus]